MSIPRRSFPDFRDLGLWKKLIFIFGTSSLFVGAIVTVGLMNLVSAKDDTAAVYEESFMEAQRFLVLNKDIERSRRALLAMLAETDDDRAAMNLRIIDAATRAVDENLGYMLRGENHIDADVKDEIRTLAAIWEEFKRTRDNEIIPLIIKGKKEQAAELATTMQDSRFKGFTGISEKLLEKENIEAREAHVRIEKKLSRTILLYVVISAAGFIVALTLLIYLSRNIVGRLHSMAGALARVKKGELNFRIEIREMDEIGAVSESLNQMIRQLYEDRINQDQTIAILNWNAEESRKKVTELEKLNAVLAETQEELTRKNVSLEQSISEVREINQKLADTKAQMIQSAKMASVGQLSAGVAHEINNPISFVGTNLNTLDSYIGNIIELLKMEGNLANSVKKGDLDEAGRISQRMAAYEKEIDLEYTMKDFRNIIEESRDGIERVASIVKGLKDFSHTGEARMMEYDVNRCLEETIKLCWHELKYKIELVKEFGDLPALYCHPQRISQVFMNILVNAAHAIDGKGKVFIKTSTENDQALVKIRDTGPGMPEEIVQRIFEPFFTTKPVGKGTGLGLSIAYGIIKEHGGAIEVESKVGMGTEFTIRLPLKRNFAEQPVEEHARAPGPAQGEELQALRSA